MPPGFRSILDRELTSLRDNILLMTSMVEEAVDSAVSALNNRDIELAEQIIANDEQINQLRYKVEEESLRVLATQFPAAGDLRTVIAAIHVAVELERMGDHAAGIARLINRLEEHEDIDSLHQLPKMARRAQSMLRGSVTAFVDHDIQLAQKIIKRDDKLDRQYQKLFRHVISEMHDDAYIHQATYLLWAGHNLERIGDRATNIAERAIFTDTGLLPQE